METHSSTFAWKIPWLQSMGLQSQTPTERLHFHFLRNNTTYISVMKQNLDRIPPETVTTLLISYTPVQNEKFRGKKIKHFYILKNALRVFCYDRSGHVNMWCSPGPWETLLQMKPRSVKLDSKRLYSTFMLNVLDHILESSVALK